MEKSAPDMTMKQRLSELLEQGHKNYLYYDQIADHLIENGVIVPPCKVGDTVWVISQWYKYTKPEIESRKILSIQFYRSGAIQYHYKDGCFWQEHIGKTVFPTREEAEQKLRKEDEEK